MGYDHDHHYHHDHHDHDHYHDHDHHHHHDHDHRCLRQQQLCGEVAAMCWQRISRCVLRRRHAMLQEQ